MAVRYRELWPFCNRGPEAELGTEDTSSLPVFLTVDLRKQFKPALSLDLSEMKNSMHMF